MYTYIATMSIFITTNPLQEIEENYERETDIEKTDEKWKSGFERWSLRKTVENVRKQDMIIWQKHINIFKSFYLHVMSGWNGINSAGPNSIEQPEVTTVSNSPVHVNKIKDPRFNMQAKKRLSVVQLISPTQ